MEYLHCCEVLYLDHGFAPVAEILVALRSLRPSRPVVLFGSVLISRIAVYGPVCTVVWEGGAVRLLPIPMDVLFILLCCEEG